MERGKKQIPIVIISSIMQIKIFSMSSKPNIYFAAAAISFRSLASDITYIILTGANTSTMKRFLISPTINFLLKKFIPLGYFFENASKNISYLSLMSTANFPISSIVYITPLVSTYSRIFGIHPLGC